ncbi:unnamed protein product [Allacma fusca]|uniref:Uncharacterized protein n=1 Tax=Allacma fusca TaxID=39272 RepID=A0A8J2NYK4_9HEXA|nr:unnamed protein product [Allacma fusca]
MSYVMLQRSAWDPSSTCAMDMKKYTHRILESSKDTAKILTIPAAKDLDFYFPAKFQMKSVQIIQLEDDSHGLEYKPVHWNKKEVQRGDLSLQESEYHYFPKGSNVNSLFPSLEGLEIKFELLKRDLLRFFPLDIFGPQVFGKSLKKLKIHGTSPDCFQYLVTLFPYITHLEMESTLTHFNMVFPIIAKSWLLMENLSVFIDSAKGFHCDSKGCNLDSVLAGIPETVCSELNRGSKSRKKISQEEIAKLQKAEVSLLNIEKLQQLQFVVEGLDFFCGICYKNHVPNFITGVTAEYALKQLPGLAVTVRMSKGLNAFDELKSALEPVADYIQLDNKYVPPELPFL